jgi:acyl-CoA synthetase (AMP-forming)/AMP-acid ligase II
MVITSALSDAATVASVLEGSDSALAVAVAAGGAPAPRLTRGELRGLVASLARRLAAAGVQPGDVVSISMENTVEFIIAFLAVTQARAVAAPLNAGYKKVGGRGQGAGCHKGGNRFTT